jgi:ankyrin repeat protein
VTLLFAAAALVGCAAPKPDEVIAAAGSGDQETLKSLLAAGGDANAQDSRGFSALAIASLNGDVESMKLLLEGSATLESESPNSNPLLLAVKSGNAQAVRLLLSKGAESRFKPNETTLLAEAPNVEIVRILLGAGADIQDVDLANRNTALHVAADFGRSQIAEILIESGAPVNTGNIRLTTPLHYACLARQANLAGASEADSIATVRALLEAGADPNLADGRHNLPLHYAARNPAATPEMIVLLVRAGSQTQYKNVSGQTPLDFARQFGRDEDDPIVKLLSGYARNGKGLNSNKPVRVAQSKEPTDAGTGLPVR